MTVLHTDRLIMKPYREDDFARMAALHGTQAVMAQMRNGAVSRDEARRYFDSYLDNWRETGISIWALYRLADYAFLGECGFWLRADYPGRSLRYILAEPYWGQGYAMEAAAAALRWGFEDKRISHVTAVSQLSNPASVQILRRLGLVLQDETHNGLAGFHRYSIARDDWISREHTS